MGEIVATPVRTAPTLTPEQAAALPRPRSFALRQVAAVLAAFVTFFALGYLQVEVLHFSSDSVEQAVRFGGFVAPWLLMLPWLRHLDVRPVPWFFLCMFFGLFATPILVGKFVNRVLALPYRDWPVEYWHASRARNVPGVRAWTIVPAADALPYHRPPAERALQVGWSIVIVTAIPVIAGESELPRQVGYLWLGTLVAVILATYLQNRVDRARLASVQRVVPEPDQPDDEQPGDQERRGQQ